MIATAHQSSSTRWKVETSRCLAMPVAPHCSAIRLQAHTDEPCTQQPAAEVMPQPPAWVALPAELLQLCFSYLDIDDSHRPER